jgi:hypothetical protein
MRRTASAADRRKQTRRFDFADIYLPMLAAALGKTALDYSLDISPHRKARLKTTAVIDGAKL